MLRTLPTYLHCFRQNSHRFLTEAHHRPQALSMPLKESGWKKAERHGLPYEPWGVPLGWMLTHIATETFFPPKDIPTSMHFCHTIFCRQNDMLCEIWIKRTNYFTLTRYTHFYCQTCKAAKIGIDRTEFNVLTTYTATKKRYGSVRGLQRPCRDVKGSNITCTWSLLVETKPILQQLLAILLSSELHTGSEIVEGSTLYW